MKELSLNVLDIAQNSVKAGATQIGIYLTQKDNVLQIKITDNGCGMSQQVLQGVTNPFFTTRTTRNVGLGLPFFKQAAEQCGGSFSICSTTQQQDEKNHGTQVSATFVTDNIDFTPVGDMVSTMVTLIQGAPSIDFDFVHSIDDEQISLDTVQMRQVLGEDISFDNFEVICWITEYLKEQYSLITKTYDTERMKTL